MISNQLLGVVNLIQEPDELGVLTEGRCLATVPFGSRYRLIDFTLSSMANSGISKVAIFAHTKYRSLMDHVGSGRNWDLHNRQSGLFVLPPTTHEMNDLRKGDLYHFYQNKDFFLRSQESYVVVTRSHMICNIDFSLVLDEHIKTGADITIVYKQQSEQEEGKARKLKFDAHGRVTDLQDHYGRLKSNLISMEMYIMKKELLIDLVDTTLAQGEDHLVRSAIMSRLHELNIRGYQHHDFLGVINTIPSYYKNSMRLLQPEIWKELFYKPGLIYTKVKDEPPAAYLDGAKAGNSLIANGCVIEGTVLNSILFRGVKVGKGAVIQNSIVMQNGEIGPHSCLDHVILDKEVRIEAERDIRGVLNSPFVAVKRKVI